MADLCVAKLKSAMSQPIGALATGIFCAIALTGAADSPAKTTGVPDFAGPWQRTVNGSEYVRDYQPPAAGAGALVDISGRDGRVPVGNYDSPILKPWAAAAVKKHGDILLAGKVAPDAHTWCNPMGVPFVLQLRDNVRFLQTPDWIMITYQNDNQWRFVHLNAQHSAHPKPTWYGESVGHYEGDTLVIDTIGIAVHEVSAIDRFGTPHTEAMHVIERYSVSDDRKWLRADFTVDDPGTFNMPWGGWVKYGPGTDRPGEHVCAENNREAAQGLATIPTATKADF